MLNLKEGKIVRQLSTLLPECQTEGPGLIAAIQKRLAAYEVPGLSWKEESASTGFFKSMMGKRRDILVIRNEQLSEWLVCIGAQDYGRFLNVTWYVTTSPKLLTRMRSAGLVGLATGGGDVMDEDLDVFDQQDLNAYVSVTRMATVATIEDFAAKRQIDLQRLERQARGLRATG